jgi:putative ATP-dependent endonuclease of the OLD family
MKASRIKLSHFRGVSKATILLPNHAVLIGDNNTGKTTILEALDLALGPDRLNRVPPVDEHDFYQGKYTTDYNVETTAQPVPAVNSTRARPAVPAGEEIEAGSGGSDEPPKIDVEVTIIDLNPEQKAKFGNYVEFWDAATDTFYNEPDPTGVDTATIREALRVSFHGWYDPEEDDFVGKSYFTRSLTEEGTPVAFSKKDKQICGFLYLRSVRTGSRALSLERGSLLDIILRLKEVRPRMWEDTINTLADYSVASDPSLGISGVLNSISTALKKYVPKEWGIEPHLKVSNLTREHLRKVITAFIATGDGDHAAPFYRQGTGTINMLVLAMLSQIAKDKQNVIFAMEEPETAIPPYAQKRIVHEIRKLASQTLFTSHSPYVLEEFTTDETVVLSRNASGVLSRSAIELPESVKPKRYRQQFRTRFCEGLLARRILVTEGATEAAAFPVACRRLEELSPKKYTSLEALGICVVDAGSQNSIPDMTKFYRGLGKTTIALCDKQSDATKALMESQVDVLLMHEEKGFENLVLKNTTGEALKRFANTLEWPQHLLTKHSVPEATVHAALSDYFSWPKGNWGIADFLAQCREAEIPAWLRATNTRLLLLYGSADAREETETSPPAVVESSSDAA